MMVWPIASGFWGNGATVNEPMSVLVGWQSEWTDKFHQIYINGMFRGVTANTEQRRMLVQLAAAVETARVEIFAVEAANADLDLSDEITGGVASGRVAISWLRTLDLPAESVLDFYTDNGSGIINYETALNKEPIRVWPCRCDKGGFGLATFGTGDFGYDGGAAPGFGLGSFGLGQMGFDAETIEWISNRLNGEGSCKFAVKITDSPGNSYITEISESVCVFQPAEPADLLEISSFNKQTNTLVLKIS